MPFHCAWSFFVNRFFDTSSFNLAILLWFSVANLQRKRSIDSLDEGSTRKMLMSAAMGPTRNGVTVKTEFMSWWKRNICFSSASSLASSLYLACLPKTSLLPSPISNHASASPASPPALNNVKACFLKSCLRTLSVSQPWRLHDHLRLDWLSGSFVDINPLWMITP